MTRLMLHKILLFILIATVVALVFNVINFSTAFGTVRKTSVSTLRHGYTKRTFTDSKGQSLIYYLYIPSNYNPQRRYPLVLLLHGDGEKSNPRKTAAQNQNALLKQAYVGVWTSAYSAPVNPYIQQRWPCFVVVPQISTIQQWISGTLNKRFYMQGFYTQKRQPAPALAITMHILDALQREYSGIDASRRYITGISSGAFGVWDAIERWPNYFAAAAPLAGAGDPTHASVLKNLPIWIFHGSKDNVVTVRGSRNMFVAIRKAGGKPFYTEFPGLKHGIWANVYGLPGAPQPVASFFPWLFSQKRYLSSDTL